MPIRPRRPCSHPGCAELVDQGRCAKHQHYQQQQRQQYDQYRGSAHERGYGAAWRKLRARILKREPLCRHCAARGVTTVATDVDHIIPKSQGGTDDESNLQPLCHACHSAKTAREDGAFGNAIRG